MKWADQTLALWQEGYGFILGRRLSAGSDAIDLRLFGRRVLGIGGPQAVRLFHDSSRIERMHVYPRLVRRALLLKALGGNSVSGLTDLVGAHWAVAASVWAQDGRIVLFDEAAKVLTKAACTWAGAPIPAAGADTLARNLLERITFPGTVGPRQWRAKASDRRTQRWACRVIEDARLGLLPAAEGSVVETVACHRDLDGRLLSPQAAAAELLNVICPVVGLAFHVTFAAHALHKHPHLRDRIRIGEEPMIGAFADEVRRFYPFVPYLRGRVRHDFMWSQHHFPRGSLVLLDIYGTNHDPGVWERPDVFDPDRFLLDQPPDRFAFVPEGESITITLIKQATVFLAGLDYQLPPQDLTIPLGQMPTRPRSGFIITNPSPHPAPLACRAGRSASAKVSATAPGPARLDQLRITGLPTH